MHLSDEERKSRYEYLKPFNLEILQYTLLRNRKHVIIYKLNDKYGNIYKLTLTEDIGKDIDEHLLLEIVEKELLAGLNEPVLISDQEWSLIMKKNEELEEQYKASKENRWFKMKKYTLETQKEKEEFAKWVAGEVQTEMERLVELVNVCEEFLTFSNFEILITKNKIAYLGDKNIIIKFEFENLTED